jgi:hypothetical protein
MKMWRFFPKLYAELRFMEGMSYVPRKEWAAAYGDDRTREEAMRDTWEFMNEHAAWRWPKAWAWFRRRGEKS